jgi:ABC-type sugar transport system ATPase subunit
MTNDIDSSATPTGPAPIATFDGVTRHYGPVTAVDGLSLQIGSGETVALLGPNGAGKTTAVELLLGPSPTPMPAWSACSAAHRPTP